MLRDDTVNRRLKELLRQKKLRQTVVAERSGIAYQSLHRAMNGRRPIYADELKPLAAAIGVDVNELLRLDGPRDEAQKP